MLYPNNQQQNQQKYVQNYTTIGATNPTQMINQNNYHYQTYIAQPNQLRAQPQYQTIKPGQNVQQVQNIPNYQNVQQMPFQNVAQKQQPIQNIQYVKVPGQTNTYVQYGQPMQQIYVQPGQQIQQTKYNPKTHTIEGNQQVMGHVHNPKEQVIQEQNIQVTNQINQPQGQKMIFKAPKPISTSHKQSVASPGLEPVEKKQLLQTDIHLNQNQQIGNTIMNPNATKIENSNKADPKMQTQIQGNQQNDNTKKTATYMSLNTLANLQYKNYPMVEFSKIPFLNISGYGGNSYNGKIKNYNEDRIKIQYKHEKQYNLNGKDYKAYISYFGVFDGHGGDGCSRFLKHNLDGILFSLPMFPNNVIESIRETFQLAETQFKQKAVKNGVLVDKSGSCALIALIINNILYSINLGDSRGLYSKNGGKEFYQITRDHKPNDPKERARIEKAGGKVYYANKVVVNGVEVTLKEEQYGPGFTFPYRLSPSGLAVSKYYKKYKI